MHLLYQIHFRHRLKQMNGATEEKKKKKKKEICVKLINRNKKNIMPRP